MLFWEMNENIYSVIRTHPQQVAVGILSLKGTE